MQSFNIGILGDVNETYEPHYVITMIFRDMQQHIPFQFRRKPPSRRHMPTTGRTPHENRKLWQ